MENNLSPNAIQSDIIYDDKSKSQREILYTQSFQCQCRKVFKTLDDYHMHIANDHQGNQNFDQIIGQLSDHTEPVIQHAAQTQANINIQNHVNGQILQERQYEHQHALHQIQQQQQQRFKYNYKIPTVNFNQNNQLPEDAQRNPVSESQSESASQVTPNQNQLRFNYIKTYYQQKMLPYYCQLDVKPYRAYSSNKSSLRENRTFQSLYKTSPVQPQNSIRFLRVNASFDKKKIGEQMDKMMIPVQNGIIEFVQNFVKEHSKSIFQMTPQKRQYISYALQQKISTLQRFYYVVYQRNPNEEKYNIELDFMESNALIAICNFITFLNQKLRFYQMWIAEVVLGIVLDTIIQFYVMNQEQMTENLKVSDLPYLFLKIQLNSQSDKYQAPFKITSLLVTQFLIWFQQWITLLQYINNKGRVDFVSPLMDQIHEINQVYRQNIINYRKCVEKRRAQFKKKRKRKMIMKNVKIQKDRMERQSLKERFKRYGIDTSIIRQSQFHSEKVFNEKGKAEKIRTSLNDSCDPHSTLNQNHRISQEVRKSQNATSDKFKHSLKHKKQVNQQKRHPIIQQQNANNANISEQRDRRGQMAGRDSKIMSMWQSKKIQKNQIHSEDDQGSLLSGQFPVYQSQYVNYFSEERVQQRKKQEKDWNAKMNHLKLMVENPKNFKDVIRQQIKKQLKEVEMLSNMIGVDPIIHSYFKKYINSLNRNQIIRQDQHIQANPSSQINQAYVTTKLPPASVSLHTQHLENQIIETIPKCSDPFQVIRNYRSKNLHEKRANQIFWRHEQNHPQFRQVKSQNDANLSNEENNRSKDSIDQILET